MSAAAGAEEVRRSDPASGANPGAARWWIAGVLGVVAVSLVIVARARPLWYDELFSLYVARLDHPLAVVRALIDGADNGPPLDPWLRHLSLNLLGENALGLRIPSILAFLLTAACAWSSLRRRGATVAAALAPIAVLVGSHALVYGIEGRAYALLLAAMAVAFDAWSRASDAPRDRVGPAVLALALFASPMLHYYGVLNFGPVLAGEAAWVLRHRRLRRRMVIAIAVGASSVALLPPFVSNARRMSESFWASAYSLRTILGTYEHLFAGSILLAAAVILVSGWAWRGPRASSSATAPVVIAGLTTEQRVAVAVMLGTPAVCWIAAEWATGVMTYRYAIVTTLGLGLATGDAVARLARHQPRLARGLVLVLFVVGGAAAFAATNVRSAMPSAVALEPAIAAAPGVVAVDNPRLFLESHRALGADARARLVYLIDRVASRQRLGFDNDEIALPALAPYAGFRTEEYDDFVATNDTLFVLVAPERYWLERRLRDEGARIDVVATAAPLELLRVIRGVGER